MRPDVADATLADHVYRQNEPCSKKGLALRRLLAHISARIEGSAQVCWVPLDDSTIQGLAAVLWQHASGRLPHDQCR